MVRQDRNYLSYILLSIVTCGIYTIYFNYKLAQDINIMCSDDGERTLDGAGIVLCSLFCQIILPVWYYSICDRLKKASDRRNLGVQESGVTVVVLIALSAFIPFVGMYILIRNVNTVARDYNARMGGGYYGGAMPYAG